MLLFNGDSCDDGFRRDRRDGPIKRVGAKSFWGFEGVFWLVDDGPERIEAEDDDLSRCPRFTFGGFHLEVGLGLVEGESAEVGDGASCASKDTDRTTVLLVVEDGRVPGPELLIATLTVACVVGAA